MIIYKVYIVRLGKFKKNLYYCTLHKKNYFYIITFFIFSELRGKHMCLFGAMEISFFFLLSGFSLSLAYGGQVNTPVRVLPKPSLRGTGKHSCPGSP